MGGRLIVGVLLVAVGLAIGATFAPFGRTASKPDLVPAAQRSAIERPGAATPRQAAKAKQAALRREHQLDAMAARIEEATTARERVEQRLDELAAEVASLRAIIDEKQSEARPDPSTRVSSAPADPQHGNQPAAAESAPAEPTVGLSATESALIAAGVDPADAVRMKRQEDALQLAQIYLRDQAVREGWADSPRFAEEMEDLKSQYPPLRDQIGDEAYDRYLAASGRPNRVRIEDVMLESPAAFAGLQTGDVVLRYGTTRIFAPDDLVTETQGGLAGERVRLELLRQGQRIEIDVQRGPLGIRIAATQAAADGG